MIYSFEEIGFGLCSAPKSRLTQQPKQKILKMCTLSYKRMVLLVILAYMPDDIKQSKSKALNTGQHKPRLSKFGVLLQGEQWREFKNSLQQKIADIGDVEIWYKNEPKQSALLSTKDWKLMRSPSTSLDYIPLPPTSTKDQEKKLMSSKYWGCTCTIVAYS